MQTFNCIISTQNRNPFDPLLFSQLEVLANALLNDSIELQQEFQIKSKFANEEFLKIYKNEQELQNIFNEMFVLLQQVSQVEDELKTVNCMLKEFTNFAENLEKSSEIESKSIKNVCTCGCCRFCLCKTERESFLELLLETNRKLEGLPKLLEDMKELRNYGVIQNPYLKVSFWNLIFELKF